MKCNHLHNVSQLSLAELCKLKKDEPCTDCDTNGPNLWICLQKGCLHIGCSEQYKDHSTIHFQSNRSHCIHMNLSSQRVWCYLCESELFIAKYQQQQQQQQQQSYHYRRTSVVSNESSDTSRYSSSVNTDKLIVHADKLVTAAAAAAAAAVPYSATADSCDSSGDEDDFERHDKWNGLVGLQNLANTCYMNAALQALSNTPPLTGFFLDCGSILETDLLGSGGGNAGGARPGLAKHYHKLIREMWCKNRRYVVPGGILCGIRIVHPMFRGYQQHDTQEFLRCFMDQLHEELKETTAPPPPDVLTFNRSDDDGDDASDGRASPYSSASASQSEGEYETCDSGVSESSSLSDDHQLPAFATGARKMNHLRLRTPSSRSVSPPAANQRSVASDSRNGASRQLSPVGSSRSNTSSVSTPSLVGSEPGAGPPGSSSGPGGGDPSDSGSTNQAKEKPQQRSIISDIFDGKLLSSVQCLTCDRVSTREETFQDLSLPIPGKDHLTVLHQSQSMSGSTSTSGIGIPGAPGSATSSVGSSAASGNGGSGVGITCSDAVYPVVGDGVSWFWWLWNSTLWHWVRSWFWGPAVTLHDCMAAFFSADELKGDNMYSCERCKKLRNGVKYSRVLALPEMLCVHLKRFRHDLSYSSKISSAVHFPLYGLDMRPYLHKDCRSEVTSYDLCAVICHHGTVGGGHYTSFAKHEPTGKWFEFDDQLVTQVTPEYVQSCEAYVLFYRKNNTKMALVRAQASHLLTMQEQASDIRFYVSRNWLHRFNTFAEPGPIDNWTLLCPHGAFPPNKASHFSKLVVPFPQALWDFLYKKFGGGPVCNHIFPCHICKKAAETLSRRQRYELETFTAYNDEYHFNETPKTIYAISMAWFRQWQLFARGLTTDDPGPINNRSIAIPGDTSVPLRNVQPLSDYAQINANLWHFFHGIYGGGPEIVLKGNPVPPPTPHPISAVGDTKQKVIQKEDRPAEVVDKGGQQEEGQEEMETPQLLTDVIPPASSQGSSHVHRDTVGEMMIPEPTSNGSGTLYGTTLANVTRPQKSVSFEDNEGYRDKGSSADEDDVVEENASDRGPMPLSEVQPPLAITSYVAKRKAHSSSRGSRKSSTDSVNKTGDATPGVGGGGGGSKHRKQHHGHAASGNKQSDTTVPMSNGIDAGPSSANSRDHLEIGSKKDRRHKGAMMKANGFFGPEGKYQSSSVDYTTGALASTGGSSLPTDPNGLPRTETFSHYPVSSGMNGRLAANGSGMATSRSVPVFSAQHSESIETHLEQPAGDNGEPLGSSALSDEDTRQAGGSNTSQTPSHDSSGGMDELITGKAGSGMSFGRRKLKMKYMKKLAARAGAGSSRASRNNAGGTIEGKRADAEIGSGLPLNGVAERERSDGVK
ncbi:ubiquitin carboxyl-terminal hydrolase 20-like [Anopheles albimanus]|nr:ubiquitin carboxyl-terminal hydrolase 20-like [Anopheles albimanus]XP_035783415.1 ubiquitin carboxyl-terminal hydrolase 20-like [Anopheles albimanus]